MRSSDYVKQWGFTTVAQVADLSGISANQLRAWYKTKPIVFELIVKGCALDRMMTPYKGI